MAGRQKAAGCIICAMIWRIGQLWMGERMKKNTIIIKIMILFSTLLIACGNQTDGRNIRSENEKSAEADKGPDITDKDMEADTEAEENDTVSEESMISTDEDVYTFKIKNLKELRADGAEIEDYYITNAGDPINAYTIDENGVLWGSGSNRYGQLGQGYADDSYHEEKVQIAENVIHVDYSQSGYMIFLTADHDLYGVGNDGTGALLQLKEFSQSTYVNSEEYAVSAPVLLMSDVKYARCGRNDVIALKEDETVWSWGVVWYAGGGFYFQERPTKVLENVFLITGGLFNHAALKKDGTVWTWGYNVAGSCGVQGSAYISYPEKAAEDVKMVWTGQLYYNTEVSELSEEAEMQRALENTVIQKKDGSFWACGINIGNTSRKLSPYYEAEEFETICTSEFYPCRVIEE